MKKAKERYVAKFRFKYGDKFDYTKSVFNTGSEDRIIIGCPKHGDFTQKVSNHLDSVYGCPKCALELATSKLTWSNDVFISKAKHVHGSKFDYSKVKYINNYTPILIGCPIHGEIETIPANHLRGLGCSKCGRESRRLTLDSIISMAKEKHGDKYDYSKVKDFTSTKDKVTITCPYHGDFNQQISNHLRGDGCPKCGSISAANSNSNGDDIFLTRAKEKHGDKYDYSKAVYKGMVKKLTIGCPIHGFYEQAAKDHLGGAGCPECSLDSKRMTKEIFIEKSKELHNDKYDYSKVEIFNSESIVKIGCPVHGEFEQRVRNHLQGKGCAACGKIRHSEVMKYDTESYVNAAKKAHDGYYTYSNTKYVNSKTPITVTCPVHGDFDIIAVNHLTKLAGCSICNRSLGEKKIAKELDTLGIAYKREYRIPENQKYSYDFLITDYKIIVEYDGEGHYVSKEKFGGDEGLERTQRNDVIKNKLALDNGYKIIRISYHNFDKVEEMLRLELSKYYKYSFKGKLYREPLELVKAVCPALKSDERIPITITDYSLSKY